MTFIDDILKDTPYTIKRVCNWTFSGLYWVPSCDVKYVDVRKPSSHDWKFCPFCGGEIKEVSGE